MKSKNRAVKSFNFTKISCNLGFGNGIIQLRVVGHHKKCLYGLYSFADAARTPHGDGNLINALFSCFSERCSPHPLRGRQLKSPLNQIMKSLDATRTPHGDGNWTIQALIVRLLMDAARFTVAPFQFPDASRPQTGAFPRNRLASFATGGASPLSPSRGRQQARIMEVLTHSTMQPAPLTGTNQLRTSFL